MKIDCHYHLRNYHFQNDLKLLQENMKKYSFEKVIILASYFPSKDSALSNYRLYYHIENIKGIYMMCSLDFDKYYYGHIAEVKELLKKDKVRGIKIYSGYQDIDYSSDRVKEIFEICPKNKFIMFHTGFCEPNKFKEKKLFNPLILEELIKEFPNTKVILAHLGNPFYKECSFLINKYKNVYTDMSGLMDKWSDKNRATEALLFIQNNSNWNKVFFGTDFPIQKYEYTKFLLEQIKKDFKENIISNGKDLFYKD